MRYSRLGGNNMLTLGETEYNSQIRQGGWVILDRLWMARWVELRWMWGWSREVQWDGIR